ncbi:MAG: hypothetical protein IJW23_01280 [Lentisphaeria bacterium]|nr:hypothetical protein [Lentisphaeria bacterium]
MGVLNRIMLILILLAAAGAAVLSYFLFEKRTEMLKGWQLMADQINTTAKKMDQGSGTKVAADIKSGEFSHRDLTAMETRLKKLSAAAEKLIQQRDALAQTISTIVYDTVGETIDKNELLKLDTYEAYQTKVAQSVKTKIQKERDAHRKIVANFAKVGAPLGKEVTPGAIENDFGDSLVDEIRKAVQEKNRLISEGNKAFRTVASVAGTSHSNDNFAASSKSVYEAVAKLKLERNTERTGRTNAEAKVNQLQRKIVQLERAKINLEGNVKKLVAEIAMLRKKINPTNDANVNRMEYQPKDLNYYLSLYSLVRNEVKKVDTKWNFVIIDLGAKTTVQQTFAGKTYKTVLDINPGTVMTVVRGIKTKTPKVIAKIVLSEVHADHAVANIMMDTVQDTIREGDTVLFLNDDKDLLKMDIQKLLSGKK